jgi:quinol monooxygenase YgiN
VPSPVKIAAIIIASPGRADEVEILLRNMAPHCRAEPGNLRWDVWRDQADPDRYVLDELYIDADAVAAHRRSPYYQAYLAAIPALAERMAILCDPIAVGEEPGS